MAFAALFPIISVLAYGQLAVMRQRVDHSDIEKDDLQEDKDHAF